jgi:hypothetical protein
MGKEGKGVRWDGKDEVKRREGSEGRTEETGRIGKEGRAEGRAEGRTEETGRKEGRSVVGQQRGGGVGEREREKERKREYDQQIPWNEDSDHEDIGERPGKSKRKFQKGRESQVGIRPTTARGMPIQSTKKIPERPGK